MSVPLKARAGAEDGGDGDAHVQSGSQSSAEGGDAPARRPPQKLTQQRGSLELAVEVVTDAAVKCWHWASERPASSHTMVSEPAILQRPSLDLCSLAICGFLGARNLYLKRAGAPPGGGGWEALPAPAAHAAAAAAAFITAFGGGTMYYALTAAVDRGGLWAPGRWRWGVLAWQQPLCAAAAAAGTLVAVPLGHPLDALSAPAGLVLAADCLNWGVLTGWASSKLALRPTPSPGAALAYVGLGWAYCAGGGATRDLIFGSGLPGNLTPVVLLPLVSCFAVFTALIRATEPGGPASRWAGVPAQQLQVVAGVPLCAAIFFASSSLPTGWSFHDDGGESFLLLAALLATAMLYALIVLFAHLAVVRGGAAAKKAD